MSRLKNVNKGVQLVFEDDVIKDDDLKATVNKLDDKVQHMLLWSTICSVWSYLVLIVIIARIYASFNGKHQAWLISVLMLIYVLMGALIWFAWKGTANKQSCFYTTSKSFLRSQVNKLAKQRRLTAYYLLEYGLLLGVASIFFLSDISNGAALLFRLTAPVSIVTYVLGLYFIGNFTRQMKRLDLVERQLNHLQIERTFNAN